jgi:hypothetical protein
MIQNILHIFLLLQDSNLLHERSVYTIRSNATASVNYIYFNVFESKVYGCHFECVD